MSNTYYLSLNGSKLGVGGFIFTPEEGGDTPVDPTPEGEKLTVEGFGYHTFGNTYEIVTPTEFDMDNKTLTFTNFAGSNSTFSIKFNKTNPNLGDEAPDVVYSSTVGEGLTNDGEPDGQGYQKATINGFNGPVVFQQDGVNSIKLDNIFLYLGSGSQLSVVENTSHEKSFKAVVMISGDFYVWDTTAQTWGEKQQYTTNMNIVKLIPLSNGTSGIEDITTDAVDANAPVEYYNLQGVRINEPAAGYIVIRRQGSKVTKVLVK